MVIKTYLRKARLETILEIRGLGQLDIHIQEPPVHLNRRFKTKRNPIHEATSKSMHPSVILFPFSTFHIYSPHVRYVPL